MSAIAIILGDEHDALAVGQVDRMADLSQRGRQPFQVRFGHGDEIGKGVCLVAHAPRVMPCLAEIAATTDVSDGVDDATVEQAQPLRRETDIVRIAVRAIAFQPQRRATVTRTPLAVHQ